MTPTQRSAKARKALYDFEVAMNKIIEVNTDRTRFSPTSYDTDLADRLWEMQQTLRLWVQAVEAEAKP